MIFETDDPIDGESASLPDTMACLLETAITDARALDRKVYTPHYDKWHQPYFEGRCFVCLAGSFIARTLEIHHTDRATARTFDRRTSDLLDAIDHMRHGRWNFAFQLVYRQAAPNNLYEQLMKIPAPEHSNFFGWDQFDKHLASLDEIIPQLQQIDREALSL